MLVRSGSGAQLRRYHGCSRRPCRVVVDAASCEELRRHREEDTVLNLSALVLQEGEHSPGRGLVAHVIESVRPRCVCLKNGCSKAAAVERLQGRDFAWILLKLYLDFVGLFEMGELCSVLPHAEHVSAYRPVELCGY